MKRKLALLLATVMVVGMIPVTAMAATTNRISVVKSLVQDEYITASDNVELTIAEADTGLKVNTQYEVELSLSGAKWRTTTSEAAGTTSAAKYAQFQTELIAALSTEYITVNRVRQTSDTTITITFTVNSTAYGTGTGTTTRYGVVGGSQLTQAALDATGYSTTLYDTTATPPTTATLVVLTGYTNGATETVYLDGDSTAYTLTVNDVTTNVTGTDNKPKLVVPMLTQVTGSDEATVSINPADNVPMRSETITFATVVTGTTTVTMEDTTTIKDTAVALKSIIVKENVAKTLGSSGTIKLKISGNFEFVTSTIGITNVVSSSNVSLTNANITDDTITISYTNTSTGRAQFYITGINVIATDDAVSGQECNIVVSGANVNTTTLLAGTYKDYGVTVTVEDKDLPVLYSGKVSEQGVDKVLKVTLKETIAKSWLASRKTTFTFNEEVKVIEGGITTATGTKNVTMGTWTINKNVATLGTTETTSSAATVVLEFTVNVEPGYEGDITCTVGGTSLGEDTEVVVATAKNPYTVETTTNEVIIDYRQTDINDIVITEAAAGVWGKNHTLYLEAEYMSFEDGSSYEIVEGDIKLTSVKTASSRIAIKVSSESVKTPAVIKLSKLSLYMSRSLAAGSYSLFASNGGLTDGTAVGFENYGTDTAKQKTEGKFDTEDYVVAADFLKIITAGRDQDDSTFTTTIKVTIGATTMTAGSQTIALDAPAYIKDGYTMMPVRAVAEALSGSAQVSWDDPTHTVMVFFGSRIIKMTIGSSDMVINGTPTPMSAAAEITNSRTFIPLRDLGYGLGLNDNKINWDDATKTATLN